MPNPNGIKKTFRIELMGTGITGSIIMNQQRRLVYQLKLPVRWADMDVNVHVNNVCFFTYFESARLDWAESVRPRAQRGGLGLVVAQANCNYHRPIPYPETVRVDLYASAPGRTSFTLYYNLLSESDPKIKYADGQTVMVWVDRASGKSLPLPAYMRGVLAPARTQSRSK
jgi:acyl-CoA thioester hydrolase